MANNAPFPIAKTNDQGIFIEVGSIILSSNTEVKVTDLDNDVHTFDIPEPGLLSFIISTGNEAGGGSVYSIDEAEPQLTDSGTLEIDHNLNLSLVLEKTQESSALSLKFIGEDDMDIMRAGADVNLIDGAEFGFERTANSLVLKIYAPLKEE